MIDWQSLLTRWSREIMASELAARVDPPPESCEWLGFAAASENDIAELEQRLGLALPPSYKAFLLTSNGWRRATSFIDRIRPVSEVDWFHSENEQWVEVYAKSGARAADAEYYVYGEEGASYHLAKHMRSLVQVSDVDDGVYLLNPKAVTPDGEWEAWFFANWVPGAIRFPSFAHLMLHEYRSFARLHGVDSDCRFPEPSTFAADVPRVAAQRVRKKARPSPSLETLIEQMRLEDDKQRAKAVRAFCGKLRGRYRAVRRPDLIQPLTVLFQTSLDAGVRSACIAALTEMAEDGHAPQQLLDALSDPHPGVILSGIFALTYFPDDRAVEPLCRFIESRVNVLFNESAVSALGTLGNARAVPTLRGVLLDTSNQFDQSFATAAMALARCGPAGFDALVLAHGHSDARVRLAAVVGLDVSDDPRAGALLDKSADDPDDRVRGRARIRMGGRLVRATASRPAH